MKFKITHDHAKSSIGRILHNTAPTQKDNGRISVFDYMPSRDFMMDFTVGVNIAPHDDEARAAVAAFNQSLHAEFLERRRVDELADAAKRAVQLEVSDAASEALRKKQQVKDAGPELLDAINALLDTVLGGPNSVGTFSAAEKQARAAIAKATA